MGDIPKRFPPPPAPNDDPGGCIRAFCLSVWTGTLPRPEVVQWLATCLSEIESDVNHPGRPAFGLTAKGRPPASNLHLEILLFVGLARRWGHTLERAIEIATAEFKRQPATVRNACRGMLTHRPSFGLSEDGMAQILLQAGRTLPPKASKGPRRMRKTPAKK